MDGHDVPTPETPMLRTVLIALLIAVPAEGQTLRPRDIASRARPAVVSITALNQGEEVGRGSGFLVRADGTLVTNHHVVDGADQLRVELSTGEVFDRVFWVSADERRDLVILRIPVMDALHLSIEDDRATQVGDPVYAMGNPLGMDGTFSDGLVSQRRIVQGVELIQISAPISPGSSGGPVLNENGHAIGIATLTLTDGQNLNLAVPARYASGLLGLNETPRPFEQVVRSSPGPRPPVGRSGPAGRPGPASRAESEELERWARVLGNEMREATQAARRRGLSATHQIVVNVLDQGQEFDVTYDLGREAATIIAVCDEDCTDLDLSVRAADGRLIHGDVKDNERPELAFRALAGTYTVRVHMARCRREPCAFAVQAFAPTGR